MDEKDLLVRLSRLKLPGESYKKKGASRSNNLTVTNLIVEQNKSTYTDKTPVVNGTTSSNIDKGVKSVQVPANLGVVMANIAQSSQLVGIIDNVADTYLPSGTLRHVQQTIPLGLVNNLSRLYSAFVAMSTDNKKKDQSVVGVDP